MRSPIWLTFTLIVSLKVSANGTEIRAEPISPEILVGLKRHSSQNIYVWDGTSELAMVASVTDAVTHRPISGATVQAVRVGGRNTEPLTHAHPAAMPPPQKTRRDGSATLVAYFRAAGSADGFSVFVGDSFLRVDAPGYQPKRVRVSPIVRLDFAPKTKHCQVAIPVPLTRK